MSKQVNECLVRCPAPVLPLKGFLVQKSTLQPAFEFKIMQVKPNKRDLNQGSMPLTAAKSDGFDSRVLLSCDKTIL
jgi:hypothetical protein